MHGPDAAMFRAKSKKRRMSTDFLIRDDPS
jgi:hypothetical protein